jgi:aminoglycoside 3-N-acetyltransferase
MTVLVHSSLSALGEVEGGAETVIQALLEVLGPEGTLVMPAMTGDAVFDLENSPTNVGKIPETFRHWPGVVRSLHPTHSVCAIGARAEALIEGHINEPSAVGPGSPWGKLAELSDGYVLLIGVDQDRNTLLHYAEDLVDAPYLRIINREYRDPATGEIRTKQLCRYPGPHRDFIGLDRLFAEGGAMRVGRIGNAVCRLIHAGKAVELELAALRGDPEAVLCTNPRCIDCLQQRADIRRARLRAESFLLTAVVDDVSPQLEKLEASLRWLRLLGIDSVEFGAELAQALVTGGEEAQLDAAEALSGAEIRLHSVAWRLRSEEAVAGHESSLAEVMDMAERLGAQKLILSPTPVDNPQRRSEELRIFVRFLELQAPAATAANIELLMENVPDSAVASGQDCANLFAQLSSAVIGLAFNPAHFAQVGEKPFLQTFYKCSFKSRIRQLYVCDGCRPDAPLYQPYTLPGQGQGEVKELMSILRCRSFGGTLCLKLGWGRGEREMQDQIQAFWHLMDTL